MQPAPKLSSPPIDDPRIDRTRLPRHIGVIMDGNGRWAEQHGKRHVEGHEAGARGVRQIIEGCRELGVPALTLYAFSTENWRRSKFEVDALFRLMVKYIRREIDEIDAQNIHVRFMGRRDRLPAKACEEMDVGLARTAKNTAMTVCVALNYGGRAEIVDATRRIAEDAAAGRIQAAAIDEAKFAEYLYHPDLSELDLLIRTSGEMRLSNFMLWQACYAEIVVLDTLWPDFSKQHLCDAIAEFQHRRRRFGGRP